MRTSKNLRIDGSKGRPIVYDLFQPDTDDAPLVIFCHGFKGFKDWGPWNLMAEHVVNQGYAFVKFNFSHNGVSPTDLLNFSDPEGFKENTTGIELEDLHLLIDHLFADPHATYDTSGCSLIGHCRGGPIVVLHAAKGDERVKHIVTWNAVADLQGWIAKYDFRQWQSDGYVIIRNSRTGEELKMGFTYWLDIEQEIHENPETRNPLIAARGLSIPWKIIHAKKDEAVPLTAAEQLHAACDHSELIVIPDTGHTFDGKHPMEGGILPEALLNVLRHTLT